MASSISSGSGQASPARRARCRQSITVDAPIDRLAAILRLDMPAAVSRSTSRMLRMGNLAPDIGLFPCGKGARPQGFADHPTVPITLLPRDPQPCSGSLGTSARDQSERLLGINRYGCSGSIGIAARHHSVRPKHGKDSAAELILEPAVEPSELA